MKSSNRLLLSFSFAAFVLGACSSSESSPPDAAVVTPDAPAAPTIKGLGQKCGPNLPACPAMMFCPPEADAAHAYCTATCFTGTFTTDADAAPNDLPDPTPGDTLCSGKYSAGAPGKPSCSAAYHLTPPAPLAPDTQYSLEFLCSIECDANRKCPTGLTCSAEGECTP